jgi:glycosylphosphatidylinositol transamidase
MEFHSSHHTHLVKAGDFMQKVEHVVRALSNLHEKLHHSTTQYLLVSSNKFISSSEYVFPVILILMPLALRVIGLYRREIQPRFQTRVTSSVVSIAWIGMMTLRLLLDCSLPDIVKKVVFALSYVGILAAMIKTIIQLNALAGDCSKCLKQSQLSSIHLATCCLAIYAQAPLLFTNFSFALPSVVLSTPCIAMLRLTGESCNHRRFLKWLCVGFAFLSSPPVLFLFCEDIITAYKSYWLDLYSPLHIIVTFLLIMG